VRRQKFHERVKQRLDKLGVWAFHGDELPSDLFASSSALPSLANMTFVTQRDALGVSVRRAAGGGNGDAVNPETFRAAIHKETAFAKDVHVKMKVFRVETQNAERAVTQVLVTASGLRADGDVALINSEWKVDWKATANAAPAISRIALLHWETVLVAEAGNPWFADSAGALLADDGATDARRQFGAGLPYWARRLDSGLQTEPTGYNGLAIGDVNNDGLEDLYVCQTGGLPNRLLTQMPDGTVQDHSLDSGVDFLNGRSRRRGKTSISMAILIFMWRTTSGATISTATIWCHRGSFDFGTSRRRQVSKICLPGYRPPGVTWTTTGSGTCTSATCFPARATGSLFKVIFFLTRARPPGPAYNG
jgi:hypothetical protein